MKNPRPSYSPRSGPILFLAALMLSVLAVAQEADKAKAEVKRGECVVAFVVDQRQGMLGYSHIPQADISVLKELVDEIPFLAVIIQVFPDQEGAPFKVIHVSGNIPPDIVKDIAATIYRQWRSQLS